MSGIRGKNTKPELMIRKALHARGLRYRIHCKELPGNPDLCLPKYRAVIFVHGCFWHGHNCHLFKWPKTRPEFWRAKIERNRAVDEAAKARLLCGGWRVMYIWECSLKDRSAIAIDEVISRVESWVRSEDQEADIALKVAFEC